MNVDELLARYRRGEGIVLAETQPVTVRPRHVAVFTSGTTGPPRAVELSYEALEAGAVACLRRLGWSTHGDERWMLSLSLAHVGGLCVVIRCLVGDGVVVPGPAGRFDAAVAVDALAREHATRWSLVPTQLMRIVRAGLTAPPSLRSVLVGGAAASPGLLQAALALGWPVVPSYGLSETGGVIVSQSLPADPDGGCGVPLDGASVCVDSDGRIGLRGPQLFSGYIGQPHDPSDWLWTSDRGRLVDGRLYIDGRADDIVITGGKKVWPGEIEAALLDEPSVRGAVVFGIDDPEWGQRLCAVVEADAPGDLKAFLRARLPSWKVPRTITVVPSLPTLPNGKPDRRRAAAVPSG